MIYTKQQLVDAFCEMKGYDSEANGTKAEFIAKVEVRIQKELDRVRADVQSRLDNLPLTAKERMKKAALSYLAKQEATATEQENEGVNL